MDWVGFLAGRSPCGRRWVSPSRTCTCHHSLCPRRGSLQSPPSEATATSQHTQYARKGHIPRALLHPAQLEAEIDVLDGLLPLFLKLLPLRVVIDVEVEGRTLDLPQQLTLDSLTAQQIRYTSRTSLRRPAHARGMPQPQAVVRTPL